MLGATDRRFERWEALPALAVAGLLLLWAVPAMTDVSPDDSVMPLNDPLRIDAVKSARVLRPMTISSGAIEP